MIILDSLITLNKRIWKLPHLGDKASLIIKHDINPLDEYWIEHAKEVLMALPSSGQLTLKDIQTELGESGQASLRSMSSTAGKTTPDLVSEFYGYPPAAPSSVKWTRVGTSANWTITSTKYRENAGSWTSFTASTRTNTVDGTVGYEIILNINTISGGSMTCGSTDGGTDLGSRGNSGTGTISWILENISTTGNNMFFNDTIA